MCIGERERERGREGAETRHRAGIGFLPVRDLFDRHRFGFSSPAMHYIETSSWEKQLFSFFLVGL